MQKIKVFLLSEKIYIGLVVILILFNVIMSSDKKKALPQINKAAIEAINNISAQEFTEKLMHKPLLVFLFASFALIIFGSFITGIILLAKFIMLKFIKKTDVFTLMNKLSACPWGIRDVFRLIILILFFTYAAGFVLAIAALFLKKDLFILQIGLLDIVAFFVIFYFIKYLFKKDFSVIGLDKRDIGPAFYWGILSYICFIPIFAAVIMLNSSLMDLLRYEPQLPPFFGFVLEEKNPLKLLLFLFQAGIVAPFVEELFFRGFLYNAVKKRQKAAIAAIITTAFFALSHQELFNFMPIFCIGFLLVYIYEKTGSLYAAIFVHSIHNLATTFLLLLIKSIALK